MKFAKLFDVTNEVYGDSQVLFYSEYDTDEDVYVVNVITDVDGMSAKMQVTFDEEEDVEDFLENADQLTADIQYRNVCKWVLGDDV